MAHLDIEQTMAVVMINQLVNDWAYDLDHNEGLSIGELVTEDCVYAVGPTPRQNRSEIETFYSERLQRLLAQPEGVPVQRHVVSNLRMAFESGDLASGTFSLVFFTTAGSTAGADSAEPAAVADVKMSFARRDGHWLISEFHSGQPFRRGSR